MIKVMKAMDSFDDVYTFGNNHGVQKVLDANGDYAYLMDSSRVEYVAAKNCQLTKVGGLIDSRMHSIALPQGIEPFYRFFFKILFLRISTQRGYEYCLVAAQ